MIASLLDACQFILEIHGEPQSSYWLASQIMEMKLWRASEAEVQAALAVDSAIRGEASRFMLMDAEEVGLRSWAKK